MIIDIDIIIPICNNYLLVDKQIETWSKIKGRWTLYFCDNTIGGLTKFDFGKYPLEIQKRVKWFKYDCSGIDGERHGGVIDYMIKQTSSKVIGIMDSDFLWLNENLLYTVESYFKQGYKCVGAELYYHDFDYVNKMYPKRAGWLAPCIFGMFIDRFLCTETFVCTKQEGHGEFKETGWRMREKLINDNDKVKVFKAFQYKEFDCGKSWFYKDGEKVVGVHLLQGSGINNGARSITILNKLIQNMKQLDLKKNYE